ncbi:hypothetical protein PHMEG_00012407 [Phytophthora megakarya]|uniref:Uncharacterized protein n=1 Tax=Phytophthora megakarya TaxID=4795 RepID=A0A225W990_9STRA|nr:hypothetical protein PHMEG_00012407 [Phytophthora megakarya]
MARLLTHWVNVKFGKFRSRLLSRGLASALRVRKQFRRNDDQLVALKESHSVWTVTSPPEALGKSAVADGNSLRQADRRQITKPCVPNNAKKRRWTPPLHALPGCNAVECPRPHLKPEKLSNEAKAVISQRWNGLSAAQVPQLQRDGSSEEDIAQRWHDQFMTTLVKVQRVSVVHLHAAARQCGIQPPSIYADEIDDVDLESIVSRGSLTLEDTVHLFRGQTQADMCPNKDLFEIEPPHPDTMAHTVNTLNSIVRDGVKPRWLQPKPLRQTKRPANHRSINDHDVHIRHHLWKGQLEGRYLIVSVHLLDQWQDIFISPLAVVDKPGVVVGDIRLTTIITIIPTRPSFRGTILQIEVTILRFRTIQLERSHGESIV